MSVIERLGPYLAMGPRSRHLLVPEPSGYVVGGDESLAAALHRVTTEQFTIAIDALGGPPAQIVPDSEVTLAAMSRIVAVLRLVRASIGDEAYRTEIAVLRDTEAMLSGFLIGQIELRALDQLLGRYESVLRPGPFAELRNQLVYRHDLRRMQVLSESDALDQLVHRLRRARARFAAWPVDSGPDDRTDGRDPVPDSFSSFADGLDRTYRRGRKRWKTSTKGGGTVSAGWLREVRQLGHQLEIVSSAWPEVIEATSSSCRRLEAVLLENQGFAALQLIVESDRTLILEGVERPFLESVCAHASKELVDIAAVLGARLYVEAPARFLGRIEAYWNTRGSNLTL